MKYSKPALSFIDQAKLLQSRGLVATSLETIVEKLRDVSYYRLSAYWYPFKQDNENLAPGTTLETIWQRYTFDRQLRLLVMDGIERIEISIRTRMTEAFSLKYGAFGHLSPSNFYRSPGEHQKLLDEIHANAKRSCETFVTHFFNKYTSETELPLWMAVEVMTLGNMLTMFRGIDRHIQKAIAHSLKLNSKVLLSWLHTLSYIRNLCAHHARLWNRILAIKPIIPNFKNGPEWHKPIMIPNDRVFVILTILRFMLKQIAPHSHWKDRLIILLKKYPDIPFIDMGFVANWQQSPIWQD